MELECGRDGDRRQDLARVNFPTTEQRGLLPKLDPKLALEALSI